MHNLALNIELYGKRTATVCGVLIALAALLYGIFLLIAVERTASRAKSEAEIKTLSTQLATLQSEYYASMKNATPERAAELGYVAPPAASQVFAVASAPALSLNNARR